MAGLPAYRPPLPATPLSFSILVTSPTRCNLPFISVSAMLFPLAKVDLCFAPFVITGLNILTSFLLRRSLVYPPGPQAPAPGMHYITLTFSELSGMLQAAANNQLPMSPFPEKIRPHQGFGPVGPDQPLFPDNLSFSLSLSAPFAPFDGSPDTSFSVPMFEVPGSPGNLIIILGHLISQFLVERSGIGTSSCTNSNSNNPQR